MGNCAEPGGISKAESKALKKEMLEAAHVAFTYLRERLTGTVVVQIRTTAAIAIRWPTSLDYLIRLVLWSSNVTFNG